ncbi:MAG TPA: EAL domain-containing protein [Kineosporiaceae bacterium]
MAGTWLSVWHFLVMIALLPTLGLPVLAWESAREPLAEAATATRVEQELLAVESVDRLRAALTAEAAAGSLTQLAKRLGLPLAAVGGQLGWQGGSIAEARAGTDRAWAAVPRIAPFTDAVVRFGPELRRLRTVVDEAATTPDRTLANLAAAANSYQDLVNQASDAEQSLAQHVGTGTEGTSSGLLARTRSFDLICAANASQARRAGMFYHAMLSGSASRSDLEVLDWESKRYQVLTALMDRELDSRSLAGWKRMTADEQFKIFDTAVANGPDAVLGGARLDLVTLPAAVPSARAALSVVRELSEFVQAAAKDTATLARADAASARRRAMGALIGTGVLIAVTIVALFVIGGVLRRRLNNLAQGAQRLSAGHLEPVAVRGPRELAATGEALNAAVATLRHVEVKATVLASGDLDSAELERPAPGPLGTAVQASVTRIVTAVREREELQRQLAHQASHDVLTGLPNRAELDRALHAALGRAARNGSPISVLFVDLDGFKACNDRFGHAAGDHVLRVAAERLRAAVRPGDLVGRLGGDEFVAIVEGVPPGRDTVRIGERIVASISRPVDVLGHHTVAIGASVGLAGCDRGQSSADQLLSEADAAVYHAKAAGRGCVVVHDQKLRTALQAQQGLETAIRHALDHNEFVLQYQPVIDLSTLRPCALEALVRWQRPGSGLVMPGDFIPAIETGDLIIEVDRWVLREATAQLARWSADGDLDNLDVWVNISGRHLINRCVVPDVRTALARSGLSPARLGIEITETVPIDSPHAVDHLRELSELGLRIALDDFGTGHTSISQLLNLPIDVLKLDRSLTAGQRSVDRNARHSRPIGEIVIEMARSLGLTVVAEGIESPEQVEALRGSRCDLGQGYLFSPPLDAAELRSWTASEPGTQR